MAPVWEQLTGIGLNVIEISFVEHVPKQLQDHQAGGGAYDVLTMALVAG